MAEPFVLPPLPYADTALAPVISANTLGFHYGKHHKTYVDNLNNLVKGTAHEGAALEQVIRDSAGKADQAPISPREFQVLRLVAHGLTNKEIAYRLTISERTVQFHLNSIFNKTGTSSRTEAVSMALLHRWLVAADLQ